MRSKTLPAKCSQIKNNVMTQHHPTGAYGKTAGRLLTTLSASVIASSGVLSSSPVHAAIYDFDIDSPQFTLYPDPYNGNEIKLGGFSGLYPVPGKPDCFYTITDRGPAPDFTDADAKAYKARAMPHFGPHI